MTKKPILILQVKYVTSEQELNDFLKTLHVYGKDEDLHFPKLQSIQYIAQLNYKGNAEDIDVATRVLAAVQYLTFKDIND